MNVCDRSEARRRRRRIIFNNDGCDCWYREQGGLTAAAFMDARTSALADSQVDTLFYNTNRGGVGCFSHTTRVGTTFTRRDGRYESNITPLLIEQGTDPLRMMVDWSRRNGREIFWSLRMNDTHDGWGEPGDVNDDRLAPIKRAHPEWLLGGAGRKPRYGNWSALNYSLEPVRDFIFKLIEEVCENYDVDGVEFDFLRHPTFFPSTAAGTTSTDTERAMMTELVGRVRRMLDQKAAARGKPLLLAIRVHDSMDLCHDIGLDVRGWMAAGWLDMVAVSGYYRLTPWRDVVDVGRRHGVPVYACLAESRLNDTDGAIEPLRQTVETYRGRALNAWQDGVDGIYVFNLFNPHTPVWREVGDPAILNNLNRIYFASVRTMGGAMWRVPNVHQYRRLPVLGPEHVSGCPIHVRGELTEVPIDAGGSLAYARQIEVRFRIADMDDPGRVVARWNGRWLSGGTWVNGILRFALDARDIRPTGNLAGLILTGGAGPVWEDLQLWVATEGSIEEMERSLKPAGAL